MIESSQGKSYFSYSTIERENFEGNFFANFAVLWLFVEFGAWCPLVWQKQTYFSLIHESFLPRKFPAIQ